MEHRSGTRREWGEGLPRPTQPSDIEDYRRAEAAPFDGVPTMLPTWNACCGDLGKRAGLARGWMVTVGGGPGKRKSMFACNMTAHALEKGLRVMYFSGELPRRSILKRVGLCMAAGVGWSMAEHDPHWIDDVASGLRHLAVNDVRVRIESDEVLTAIERWGPEYDLVVLDYMQQTLGSAVHTADEIKTVAEEMKGAALRHGFVAVIVSQLTRDVQRDGSDMPGLYGLAGGSALERHSDQVVMFGTAVRRIPAGDLDQYRTWVGLEKVRDGQPARIPVVWDSHGPRIREGGEIEWEEWPEEKQHARRMRSVPKRVTGGME
ncbi:MAG: DnaB-like helicase C-terminal domain-containing protein [Desulfuromonadales bacterium]|nr:DnaB-like helicase C-terminal domain-containing protein [Desulfuromonadales bacterium]